MLKKLIGFENGVHTIALGRIVGLVGIVAAVAQVVDWSPLVPAQFVPFLMLGLGVAIELVRRYKADDV